MENLVNKFWRIWTSKYSLFVYEFKTLDFYFSWVFFFTLRLFQSFNCEKKTTFTLCNRKLHFNPLFCKLIRNAPGVYSIQHMSSFPGLFANSWPPPPILLFFRRCPYLPFSEINIKMTFILGHSYFKGIYSVYVEDGLCITLMDSKGQLLLNELSN